MKVKYKGLTGIAALKLKKSERKPLLQKTWRERRGIISRICNEMIYSGNRRIRRQEAKDFMKNPEAFGHLFKKG